MAFTVINLTEAVPADELSAYGAKAGQHDCFPNGIAVFCVNTGSSAITAGARFVNAAGELKSSTASGLLSVTTLADCPAGAGVYGIAQGIVPGSTPAYKAYTIAS